MGAYRDEQLFGQMDAERHGYDDGHRTATNVAYAIIGDVLGVSYGTVEDLTSRNLGKRLLALEGVQTMISSGIELAEIKKELYEDEDPGVVAQAIIKDQLPEEDHRGYQYSDDYKFVIDDTGNVQLLTYRIAHSFHDRKAVGFEWVQKRLEIFGVQRDEQFCTEIIDSITTQLTTSTEEVTNG